MIRRWVVRVALSPDEVTDHSTTPLLECLRYAGVVQRHQEKLFDVIAPANIATKDTKTWAERNAERMRTFGYNAVAAPQWKAGEGIA